MTFVVSGVLSLSIVYVVYFVEKEIVSETLGAMLERILEGDIQKNKPFPLDRNTRFFASDRPEYAIPEEFSRAKTGFSEMGKKKAYWVYAREMNGQRYLLVHDQREFEARERIFFRILFLCFLSTVACAWGIGRLMARQVMKPIIHLAKQVKRHNTPGPLVHDYAADEIGYLAKTLDDALLNLNFALERERLFTSDVSHELRTPLMIVATSCELLENADLSGHEREQLERIAHAAEEMRDLVETFLMLARMPADRSSASAGAMVENVLDLTSAAEEQRLRWLSSIRSKGLALEIVEEKRDPARYNAVFLRSVMCNLLRNALHYTDRGWIRLVLENGGFRVEDSGIGIPKHEKEQVFQPFTRGGQTRGEGLGLGLSLVRRICIHQKWTITLDDMPEGGSCFRVKLG